MCQYCGCYEIDTIRRLMDEHVIIQNHAGDAKRAIAAGDYTKAVSVIRDLYAVMQIHNTVEEKALYPSVESVEEFSGSVTHMYEEHDELDAHMERVMELADAGTPQEADWDAMVKALDDLYEHIIAEDNGMFPAAAISFDPEDWERAEQVRAEAESARGA